MTAASAVSTLPMQAVAIASALPFSVEGRVPPETEDPRADVRMVAHGYFETMKIPLLEGRFFDERDSADATRTALINETMARRFFPDRSPVGLFIENPHGRNEVVGVVADVRNQGLDSEPKKQVYLPLRQNPVPAMSLVARTERDPMAFATTLRREIWAVDAAQPIYDLSTMDQILARAVFLPRLSTTLLAIFAGAALLLAALGIYGVLSYSVTQRTREIGLRMALGATARETVGLVVRNSMLLIVAGIGVGLLAATVLARSMAGILYGVSHVRSHRVRRGRSGVGDRRVRCQSYPGSTRRSHRPDGGAAGAMRCDWSRSTLLASIWLIYDNSSIISVLRLSCGVMVPHMVPISWRQLKNEFGSISLSIQATNKSCRVESEHCWVFSVERGTGRPGRAVCAPMRSRASGRCLCPR